MIDKNILENLKSNVDPRQFLTPKGKKYYVCPYCNSGLKKNGTASMYYYSKSNKVFCFACGKSADAIDIYSIVNGCGFVEAVSQLSGTDFKTLPKELPPKEPQSADSLHNYSAFYSYRHKDLLNSKEAQQYLASRGILKKALALKWGFNDWKGIKGIIIPINQAYYIERVINSSEVNGMRYMQPKGVPIDIFNKEALSDKEKEIFVVEGVFDAMSVLQYGGSAISLNSVSNFQKLLDTVKVSEVAKKKTYILCLDRDEAGAAATKKISEGLREMGVECCIPIWGVACKDLNEFLVKDKERFISFVENWWTTL